MEALTDVVHHHQEHDIVSDVEEKPACIALDLAPR
jgi:hypothetical protein